MAIPKTDRNRVDIVGEVAGPAQVRRFDSGAVLLAFPVRVRATDSDGKPVTDNLPVAWWDPALDADVLAEGARVRIRGRLRRRFWSAETGLRSTMEVVAVTVEV